MRLLSTKTLELEEYYENIPKYAILSHRWGPDEVNFHDFSKEQATRRRGWPKVLSCCQMAVSRAISHVWIDTCCIDKSSSAELSESINSMYAYYGNAQECYAFLSDVHASANSSTQNQIIEELSGSVWFTRGWTLQELIAPSEVLFFNSEWQMLGTRNVLSRQLQKITHISARLLKGKAALTDFSLAQRMAWAAGRTTTRPEDEAYCLLGIFQVNMPLLYGEGRNAFRRLQEEIIKQSDDQTLFAWHDDRDVKPVLAPSVACFKDLHNLKCIYATNDARFGHTLSNSGLNIKLMLIPWAMDVYVAPLSCGQALTKSLSTEEQPLRGYSRMGIFLRRTRYDGHLVRVSVIIDNGYSDSVMLDSNVVAKKRDSFRIKDRQIFVRQSLVDMPDEIHHSFTFSFNHPQMFRDGFRPTRDVEVLNRSFVWSATPSDPHYGFIQERYRHFESAVFDISSLSASALPHYLRLGYDLNFVPVCLITTESKNDANADPIVLANMELHGMSSTINPVASLPWLLSKVNAGHRTSDTLLAFRVRSGSMTSVRCEKLSLRINFELKQTLHSVSEWKTAAKMWHVTFEPFTSMPNTPATPAKMSPSPASSYRQESPNTKLPSRPKKGKQWVRFFTLGKTEPQRNDRKAEQKEDRIEAALEYDSSADITYLRHSSAFTAVPEPSSSLTPYEAVTSRHYSVITPAPSVGSPEDYPEIPSTRPVHEEPYMEPIPEEAPMYELNAASTTLKRSKRRRALQSQEPQVVHYELDATSTSTPREPADSWLADDDRTIASWTTDSRIVDVSDAGLPDIYYLFNTRE